MKTVFPFRYLFVTLFLFATWFGTAGVSAATIQALLDRDNVMVGETVTLEIAIKDGTATQVESFPNIPGLSIQYQGPKSSISIVNGQRTSSFSLLFAVTASEPGEYTIPSIRVGVTGATLATQPVRLTVTKADARAQNRAAFLTLKTPRNEVYVGELLPIEIQLYVTQARDLQAPQLKSDGFVIQKEAENTKSTTQIGNIIYNVLTFRKSISAAKAGDLALGPAEMNLTLLVRTQGDPRDPLSEFFGRNVQSRPTKLESETLRMRVLPLPPNAPSTFNGAIGRFSWSVDATPKTVTAGDPVTIKIRVAGEGNLEALRLPDWQWPDFKSYQPNANLESGDPLGFQGSKTFELVVVPLNSGVTEIPPLEWAYFNPVEKSYKTLATPAFPLTVNAPAGGQATPTVLTGKAGVDQESEPRKDIVHIKANPGHLAVISPPLIQRPWFLILQAVPVIGFAGATLWRKRREKLANSPRLRRKLEVRKTVDHGLAQLGPLADANNAEEVYALVFRLLQEQLGERLDLPASAITEAVLDERLPQKGASPQLTALLHDIFAECNQARYSPVSTHQKLRDLEEKTKNAIGELRQLPE